MGQLISQTEPVARKDYRCQACEWILNEGFDGFTISEYRLLVKAKRDGWKIKKGQKYVKQFCEYDGEVYTWRARPEIHAICLKHDLYDND